MNAFATVNDLLLAFDRLHVSQLKDPRPTRCKLALYFGPLRPLPLESLTVPTVLEWYNGIKAHRVRPRLAVGPNQVQADACLSILRTALNRAIEWDMFRGPNVAKLVKRRAFPRRKRYVMKEERPALITEIDKEPLMLRVYFYMTYYTGSRPGEIQRVQIKDVKLFKRGTQYIGVLIKPTTKNGDVQQVPLPEFVCDLLVEYLATLPATQTDLFIGSRGTPPSKEWWHGQWVDIRRRARLDDVQQRDLRRTCATDLTEHLDLVTISKGVLNHRDLNTTQIYVQPINARIVDAMNLNVSINRAHLQPQGGHHGNPSLVLSEPVGSGVHLGDAAAGSTGASPDAGV
jgi:integrase